MKICKKIYNNESNAIAVSLHEFLLSMTDCIIEAISREHFTKNKDFLSKFDQILCFLRIWSHILKKSLMENFSFFAEEMGLIWVEKDNVLNLNSKELAKRFDFFFYQNDTYPITDITNFVTIKSDDEVISPRLLSETFKGMTSQRKTYLQFVIAFHFFMGCYHKLARDMLTEQLHNLSWQTLSKKIWIWS